MIKIFLKAFVLFLIIVSVYFIVHPSACSNLLAGRETIAPVWAQDGAQPGYRLHEQQERLSSPGAQPSAQEEAYNGLFDTNTLQETAPKYSQEEIDYAIASRYVELEREYTRQHKMGKDTAHEIAAIVMDDFEMSPAEWDSFISRATATDLFNKVRRDFPASAENN